MEASRKLATFRHRIFRSSDDRLCFDVRFRVVLMNLERRRAVSIPEDLQLAMSRYLVEEEKKT